MESTPFYVGLGCVAFACAVDVLVLGRPILCKRKPQSRMYRSYTMSFLHSLHSLLLLPLDSLIGNVIRYRKRFLGVCFWIVILVFTLPLTLTMFLVAVVLRILLFPFRSSLVLVSAKPKSQLFPPASPRLLVSSSLNVALSEFDIMNAINHLSPAPWRVRDCIDCVLEDKPHFLGMQEMFDPVLATKVAKILSGKGYHVAYQIDPPQPFGMSSGLLIASVYPIETVQFSMYTNGFSDDVLAAKGCITARVALPVRTTAKSLVFATTHLQAATQAPKGKPSNHINSVRSEQLEVLNATIRSVSNTTVVGTLVVGDFNMVTGKSPLSDPMDSFLTSGGYVDVPIGEDWANYPAGSFINLESDAARSANQTILRKKRSVKSHLTKVHAEDIELTAENLALNNEFDTTIPRKEGVIDHILYKGEFVETGCLRLRVPWGSTGICSDHCVTVASFRTYL